MTAIQTSEGRQYRLPEAFRQFRSSLKGVGITVIKSVLPRSAFDAPWRNLNERLLRDIGKSPTDAEIAWLQARLGARTADFEQRATYLWALKAFTEDWQRATAGD